MDAPVIVATISAAVSGRRKLTGPARFWRQRHCNEVKTSRHCRVGLCCYLCPVNTYNRPDVGTKHDQGKLAAREVLLIADVLIRGHQHVETLGFRGFQKVAVFKLYRPSRFDESAHRMVRQESSHTDRDVLIKQDAQRGDSWRTSQSPECNPAGLQTVRRFPQRLRHSQNYQQSR